MTYFKDNLPEVICLSAGSNFIEENTLGILELNDQIAEVTDRYNTEQGQQEHFKIANQMFPDIVLQEIQSLLKITGQNDVSKSLSLLYQLRNQGLDAIWSEINVEVTLMAQRQLGTVFSRAHVEAQKYNALNPSTLKTLADELAQQIRTTCPDLKDAMELAKQASNSARKEEMNTKFDRYIKAHPVTPWPKPSRLTSEERKRLVSEKQGPSLSETFGQLQSELGAMQGALAASINAILLENPELAAIFPPVDVSDMSRGPR